MSKKTPCGRRFPRDRTDFQDETGCLLPEGHKGPHQCNTKYTGFIAWEIDWDCGCADCRTDDIDDMCITYENIDQIKAEL